ncbi:MAG TPA: sigma 54-interacting transcriptional regulator [Ktedonobacterales bacterium]
MAERHASTRRASVRRQERRPTPPPVPPGQPFPFLASPSITLSRARCAERGLDPALMAPLPVPAGAAPASGDTFLRALVRRALEDIYQFIEGSASSIAFADADGRLVEVLGDPAFLRETQAIGWEPGTRWREEYAGTNGLALALLDGFPTQTVGEMHYCQMLQPYCLAAAPVYDSMGTLIGALATLTRAGDWSPHTLGMVSAGAMALTGALYMHLWQSSADELLFELNAIVQTLSEGVLLLQADGVIKRMNARAGQLLRISPAHAIGRRLREMVDIAGPLEAALRTGQELHDEEVTFHVAGARVACLCTLRPIAPGHLDDALPGGQGVPLPLRVAPQSQTQFYVLTLRGIERVQRLVHRMSGAQARLRFTDIIGQSPALLEATRLAKIAAQSATTTLLHGETGTGKEIFAQSIHSGGARRDGPFVAINCAAIPRELISSELFGYEGGSFTGADRQGRPGKFELAHTGTLFLDEVGDMPLDLQTSLLRAIETQTVIRVGGQSVIPVDVRIIAATHKSLEEEVRRGNFRADLFFRLNVFPIETPALRDRPGDVVLLLRRFLQRLSTQLSRPLSIQADALAALEAYDWPGNVRELENLIERAVHISESGVIGPGDLPGVIHGERSRPAGWAQYGALGVAPRLEDVSPLPPAQLRQESANAEAALIRQALAAANANTTLAARALGVSRTTLWRKRARYGI